MLSNMPKGDNWELVDNDENSLHYKKIFKFKFSYIQSDQIKKVVKTYAWRNYKEKSKALNYLYRQISIFKKFNDFAVSNNIFTLKELTNNEVELFVSYLKTIISKRTNKPLSYNSQRTYLNSLKTIIYWGQIYLPNEVPNQEIFTGSEYTGVNRKSKIEFIPDKVLEKINLALKNEENAYLKYGIIILQATGMRISDLLKLKVDCLEKQLITNDYLLSWYDHKNRKWRNKIAIPSECAIAIEKLIEVTDDLRKEAVQDMKGNIFIHRTSKGEQTGQINNIGKNTYSYWFNKFIENNNITDSDGELYNLTAHQFRRTLATDMQSKGANILVVKDILGVRPETAYRHYADVKDKERAGVFDKIGIIGDINNINEEVISDKEELEWFKENKDKGARMCDGYCTKPIENGKICPTLEKKKRCYTCKRYITTPEYLEVHKKHLKELQKQLDNNIYGQHYADHIRPTIAILEEIVARLEEYNA